MSLFSEFLEIKGTIEVLSPLHVGSGRDELMVSISETKKDQDGNPIVPTVASVETDANGMPYLPGSGIKGALKNFALNAGADSEAISALFGEIKDKNIGQMGSLIIYGATFESAPILSSRPHFEKTKGKAYRAQTKINSGRGTADHQKLFHSEQIVPHTKFKLQARFSPPLDAARRVKALALLADIKKALEDGNIQLGRSTANGAGLIRANAHVLRKHLGSSGDMIEDKAFKLPQAQNLTQKGRVFRLELVCEGPFYVNDWSHVPKRDAQGKATGPQLRMLREQDGDPILPIETIMGAMRARAEWRKAKSGSEASDVVDRLFGSTKAKARLVGDKIRTVSKGLPHRMTSVALDRFSGAPLTGALFEAECVFDPKFELVLRMNRATDDDVAEAQALIDDIKKTGLKLGHAKGRGFGWFLVREI
jgi:CRISPR/Cas system CSM-associated protein Csm3 (group 7 of RAMP superfamily)